MDTAVLEETPFAVSIANAVAKQTCGVCGSKYSLMRFFECASADTGGSALYICAICFGIYDSTAETLGLDIVEWQKRWAGLDDFYEVPKTLADAPRVEQSKGVFEFFEKDLGVKFKGHYLEIGAGAGLMAAAALDFFDTVAVFDHVQDRLLQTKALVNTDRYEIVTTNTISDKSADCILIWHAMEHLLAPGRVFGLCAKTLKPGGHLLIQVPILSKEHVYPGHYFYYSEPSFRHLAKQWGLEVIKFYYDHAMNGITVSFRKP